MIVSDIRKGIPFEHGKLWGKNVRVLFTLAPLAQFIELRDYLAFTTEPQSWEISLVYPLISYGILFGLNGFLSGRIIPAWDKMWMQASSGVRSLILAFDELEKDLEMSFTLCVLRWGFERKMDDLYYTRRARVAEITNTESDAKNPKAVILHYIRQESAAKLAANDPNDPYQPESVGYGASHGRYREYFKHSSTELLRLGKITQESHDE
ncbi:MAG: hypothetical protein HN445_05920, partial [Bacteroidetes Order II. Incertae sedis bacterium]|nr:hypothetical protein [Bacteroidetes Order II. bacterium]